MFKNKKLLFIFLFVIVFFLFLNSNVFASNGRYNVDTFGFTPSAIDFVRRATVLVANYVEDHNISYSNYFIFHQCGHNNGNLNNDGIVFKILLFNNDVYVGDGYNGCLRGGGSVYCFEFTTGEDLSKKDFSGVSPFNVNNSFDGFRVFYTNYEQDNLVSKNENSSFFHEPPQGILAPIVEESKPEITLEEIANLLPLIIVVVVFLVGLRKGLALLLQILRKA